MTVEKLGGAAPEDRICLGHIESTGSNEKENHTNQESQSDLKCMFTPTLCNAVLINTPTTTLNMYFTDPPVCLYSIL